MSTATPPLARREGVELIRTGRWGISTGQWDAAREDLVAAVAALSCPAVRKPIIKIGHTDRRFQPGDGEPSLGWFDNLRLTDGGHTLIADQVAPAWLSEVQAAAWPNRSVEGSYNFRCGLGHTHPFVLTAVALLGVTPPGVSTLAGINDLADVKALYGIAASDDTAGGGVRVVARFNPRQPRDGDGDGATGDVRAAAETGSGAMVALIPTAEDTERLAVEGGEPAEQLHVTLAYLGDAANLSPADRQDLIDAVSSGVNGFPVVDAQAFALNVFNPGKASDRDTCIVLGLSGELLDAAHTVVNDALNHEGVNMPRQHAPWHAHLTLTYTDDLSALAGLVDRVGPVRFDRIRIALAGQHIDIPLLLEPEPVDGSEGVDPDEVQAAEGGENNLREFFTRNPKGLARWASKPHPWTALYRILRRHVGSERAKRIASSWFHRVFGYWSGDRRHRKASASNGDDNMPNPNPSLVERIHGAWNASNPPEQQWIVEAAETEVIVMDNSDRSLLRVPVTVDGDTIRFGQPERVRTAYVSADALPVEASRMVFASAAESRPAYVPDADPLVPAGAPQPAPVDDDPTGAPDKPPAAEPGTNNNDPSEEDSVSDWSELRSRLGLGDDADEAAVLAALDVLKTRADSAPDPEQVAASAAKRDELEKEVQVLAAQVTAMSAKLAATEAEKAATVKASVIDKALKEGKISPADREQWEKDYDEAPGAVTRVLASIAPGTAVPVAASGYTGDPDETTGDPLSVGGADYNRLFGIEEASRG